MLSAVAKAGRARPCWSSWPICDNEMRLSPPQNLLSASTCHYIFTVALLKYSSQFFREFMGRHFIKSSWTHMQRPIDRFKYSLIQLFNYVRFNDTGSREFDRDTSQHALLIISWWNRLINSSRKWKSRNVLLFCAIYRRTITLVSGLLVVNWSGNTSSRKKTSNISIQPARWRKSSRNALVTNNVRWRCQSKEVPPIINYCS